MYAGELIGFRDASLKRFPSPQTVTYGDNSTSAIDVVLFCLTCSVNKTGIDLVESVWDGRQFSLAEGAM